MEKFAIWDAKEKRWIAGDGDTWDANHPRLIGGIITGIERHGDSVRILGVSYRVASARWDDVRSTSTYDTIGIYCPTRWVLDQDISVGDKITAEIFPTRLGCTGRHDIFFSMLWLNRLDRRL